MGVAFFPFCLRQLVLGSFSSCARHLQHPVNHLGRMQIFVKCTSGSYEFEMDGDSTITELLEKAKGKHAMPSWADGVQLVADGADEDLVEDASRTLSSVGILGGTQLKMKYYKNVPPAQIMKLKSEGLTSEPFLMKKQLDAAD